jgi:hypothetical protein
VGKKEGGGRGKDKVVRGGRGKEERRGPVSREEYYFWRSQNSNQ